MNGQIGGTTVDRTRRIELLRGPSLNKSTAYTEPETLGQPSNVIWSVSTERACHRIDSELSVPTEVTKGVNI
jgi:hypothetical protein